VKSWPRQPKRRNQSGTPHWRGVPSARGGEFVAGHGSHPQGEILVVLPRGRDQVINDIPAVLSFCRFQIVPEQPEIGDRHVGVPFFSSLVVEQEWLLHPMPGFTKTSEISFGFTVIGPLASFFLAVISGRSRRNGSALVSGDSNIKLIGQRFLAPTHRMAIDPDFHVLAFARHLYGVPNAIL